MTGSGAVGHDDGNYPVPSDVEKTIRLSLPQSEWRFLKGKTILECYIIDIIKI